jgi:hypothetical protein
MNCTDFLLESERNMCPLCTESDRTVPKIAVWGGRGSVLFRMEMTSTRSAEWAEETRLGRVKDYFYLAGGRQESKRSVSGGIDTSKHPSNTLNHFRATNDNSRYILFCCEHTSCATVSTNFNLVLSTDSLKSTVYVTMATNKEVDMRFSQW